MSNLIATEQVGGGDWIQVDFDPRLNCMTFLKQAERIPPSAMAELVAAPPAPYPAAAAAVAKSVQPAPATRAGS
jgi:hypothetical protein